MASDQWSVASKYLENRTVGTSIIFGVLFAWMQVAEPAVTPRASATDTAYLSCTTWTGKGWTEPTARSASSPVLVSATGLRAYAEVKVVVKKDGSCENASTLNIASGTGRPSKVVYAEPKAGTGDGNGIRVVGWSPSGDKLLVEENFWKYETDRGFGHASVIYDASTGRAAEIRGLGEALERRLGQNCEYETALIGWKTEDKVLVKVSRTPPDESYEQHFCVTEPLDLTYDLRKHTLDPEPVSKN